LDIFFFKKNEEVVWTVHLLTYLLKFGKSVTNPVTVRCTLITTSLNRYKYHGALHLICYIDEKHRKY
jgi:hypothetical protein